MADDDSKEDKPEEWAAFRRRLGAASIALSLAFVVFLMVFYLHQGNSDKQDNWYTLDNKTAPKDHAVQRPETSSDKDEAERAKSQHDKHEGHGSSATVAEPIVDPHQPESWAPDPSFPVVSKGIFPHRQDLWHELLKIGKPEQYDASDPPNWGKGVAAEIDVSVKILSLIDVNMRDNHFAVDFCLRLRWQDDRLVYSPPKIGQLGVIVLGVVDEAMNGGLGPIWRPDIYFQNIINANIADTIGTHTEITPQGTVFWSRKMSATFIAKYRTDYYPFDRQRLGMRLGDFRGDIKSIRLNWNARMAATVDSTRLSHPLYRIDAVDYLNYVERLSAGDFDVLEFNLRISRRPVNYIFKIIFPVFCIVILGSCAYRIDVHIPKNIPARVGVVISCVLTQSAFTRRLNMEGPKIKTMTWMDLYVSVAFLFNTVAMVEMAFVMHSMRNNTKMEDGMDESEYIDNHFELYCPVAFFIFTVVMLIIGVYG